MIFRKTKDDPTPRGFAKPIWAVLGVVTGGLSAMMGIGGGTIGVPLLNFLGYDIRRAVGTSAAIGFIIGLPRRRRAAALLAWLCEPCRCGHHHSADQQLCPCGREIGP